MKSNASIQREWDSYNPITNPVDPSLSCNINGAVLALQKSATVPGMLLVDILFTSLIYTLQRALPSLHSGTNSPTPSASVFWTQALRFPNS